jgi:formamidopyrimidine-DNA glycosylase
MPELPEVESTVQYLKERIEGLSILDTVVHWNRTIATPSAPHFIRSLQGLTIRSVFRRGKYIGIELEGGKLRFLFIHLRMSGSLDVVSTESPISTHDRVIIALSNRKSLRFNDTRKFGRMYLCEQPGVVVGHLGVEPLSADFSSDHLHAVLTSRSGGIKQLLLNQSIIAGLGNIYVDEVLWKACIHPRTCAHAVPGENIELLHAAIQETLREAISLAGTDFGDGVVYGGMYTPVVYGREGEACHRCKTKIQKIVVGQRGTHLCPTCQKQRRSRYRRHSKTEASRSR